jgi:hypothetical protein
MTDANQELLNTLDYLALNMPQAIGDQITGLEDSSVSRASRKTGRFLVVHYMGLYSLICIIGGNGGIPPDRRNQYTKVLRALASVSHGIKRLRVDVPPVVIEEVERLGFQWGASVR